MPDFVRALLRSTRPLRTALLRVAPALSRTDAARRRVASLLSPPADAPGADFVPFGTSGIEIAVTSPPVPPGVARNLRDGTYEGPEARSAPRLLVRRDVVVELGAGIGLISSVVMKSGKAKAIHCFEADARMIPLIHATHRRNGITRSKVYHAAVTADRDSLRRGEIALNLHGNFLGNSVTRAHARKIVESVTVPTCSLRDILRALRPTVLLVDIEGAEAGLFRNAPLGSVRHIAVELHPRALGGHEGVRRLFADLHEQGFAYDTRMSAGAVPVFSRV